MPSKFSALFWAIFFLALLAFLESYRRIRDFIKAIFGESGEGIYVGLGRINWFSWLFTILVILIILMILAIFLWRRQLKITKIHRK